MRRLGSGKQSPPEGLREERAALVHRYTVDASEGRKTDDEPKAGVTEPRQTPPSSRRRRTADYLIEVEPVRAFLWRWSLFELIELGGDRTHPPMPSRSPDPVATAGFPRLSRRAAVRAAQRAAHAVSAPPTQAVARKAPPAARRGPRSSRAIVRLLPLLLVAALIAGAIVETRGNSHHSQSKPLTPPTTTGTASPSNGHRLSVRRAVQLDDQGYLKMRSGNYRAALPLLERAVERLKGTGSLNEAYAEFNLANTRYHLGRCSNVLALLARSQQIQGGRGAIDTLRRAAHRTCG